jgi:hypothetical protein
VELVGRKLGTGEDLRGTRKVGIDIEDALMNSKSGTINLITQPVVIVVRRPLPAAVGPRQTMTTG